MSVLVTGFGAFADQLVNPSGQLAAALDGERVEDHQVCGLILPVATARVGPLLAEALDRVNPQLVLLLGLAPGRLAPALERVAVNVRDFPLPDVDGACPLDQPVVSQGPDGYLSTLPVKAVLAAWQRAGLPGYVSNTAGTYVCNQAYYLARHLAPAPCRVGLVHLPATPESAAAAGTPPAAVPTLPLAVLHRAVTLALGVGVRHAGTDLQVVGGALS